MTDAWMQQPVAYTRLPNGNFSVTSFWALLTNPWALIQYAHNMCGALATGAFVMAGIGAFYLLDRKHDEYGRIFLRVGVIAGVLASMAQEFPTGDLHGKYLAKHQPVTIAAMEGLFKNETGAPMVILGQPDAEHQRIDNPIIVNKVLSLLVYGTTTAEVQGLNAFPKDQWPTNIPLLYFAYHIMVGLGTIMMAAATFLLWRHLLYGARWMLWIVLLCVPFPYIANTAGWLTAEGGRRPWLVYGLLRTPQGYSSNVNAANGLFTLLGYMGLYLVLGILFIFIMQREIAHGPGPAKLHSTPSGTPMTAA